MQKSSLYGTIVLLASIIIVLHSCVKKVNGINNDQVVETPYSLYFSDTAGALYNSNDGKTIQKTVFKADGFPCRAICIANNNILWAKTNLLISSDNGTNFNRAYDSLATFPFTACNGLPEDLNQSMIVNIPDWSMVFSVTNYNDYTNFLGVVYSLNQGGARGSWWIDKPDTAAQPGGPVSIGYFAPFPYIVRMTSYALLKNGVLAGYDANSNRNFYRTKTTLWNECTAFPDTADWPSVGLPTNRSGNPLPHHNEFFPSGSYPIDTTARYSYGHYNNRLIAIDQINCKGNGAYYSDDTGRNWTAYTGLPAKPLLCIAAPFEEICLIGTDSAGLYVLNNNTGAWQQQKSNGLGTNLIVRSIAAKENIFKNGSVQKYVYLATNLGIYQSTDGGYNWTLTIRGNFVAVY